MNLESELVCKFINKFFKLNYANLLVGGKLNMYCCLKFSKGLIDYKSFYSKSWDYGESKIKCIFDDRGSVFRLKRPISFNKFLKLIRKE